MKKSRSVIWAGITGGICMGLLAACGDRQGAFKARRYTADEIAWQIQQNGKDGPRLQGGGGDSHLGPERQQTTVTTPTGGTPDQIVASPGGTVSPIPIPGAGSSDRTGGGGGPGAGGGGAETRQPGRAAGSKFIIEKLPTETDRDQFIHDVEEAISGARTNKNYQADDLVKGITFEIHTVTPSLKLSFNAVIILDGKEHILSLVSSELKFSPESKEVHTFPDASLKVLTMDAVPLEPSGQQIPFSVKGTCKEASCADVYLSILFKVDGGYRPASFVLKSVKVGALASESVSSNLVPLKSFKEAQEGDKTPAGPAQTPGAGAAGPQAGTGGAALPGAQGPVGTGRETPLAGGPSGGPADQARQGTERPGAATPSTRSTLGTSQEELTDPGLYPPPMRQRSSQGTGAAAPPAAGVAPGAPKTPTRSTLGTSQEELTDPGLYPPPMRQRSSQGTGAAAPPAAGVAPGAPKTPTRSTLGTSQEELT
ncbi:MAG: hypothetical protein AB7P49_02875, partial [Bdellovibrionales bacterium]